MPSNPANRYKPDMDISPSPVPTCNLPMRQPRTIQSTRQSALAWAASAAVAFSAVSAISPAAWAAGRVTLAEGQVVAQEEGVPRALGRDAVVLQGSNVATGPGSRAALRMDDGQAIVLAAQSQFRIQEFRFKSGQATEGSVVVSLLRGALRMVTGLVAKSAPQNVRLVTSTATIGIRGTEFLVSLSETGELVVQVTSGAVEVSTAAGAQVFGPGSVITVSAAGVIAVGNALSAAVQAQFQALGGVPVQLVQPVSGAAGPISPVTATAAPGAAATGAQILSAITPAGWAAIVAGGAIAVGAASSGSSQRATTSHGN